MTIFLWNKAVSPRPTPPLRSNRQKIQGVSPFCIGQVHLSDGHGVSPGMLYSMRLHWKKTKKKGTEFPFASRYQLHIASWLGGTLVLSELGLHLSWTDAVLVCVTTAALSSYVRQACSRERCFLGVISHLWLLESFSVLFCIDPWLSLEGTGLMKTSQIGLNTLKY